MDRYGGDNHAGNPLRQLVYAGSVLALVIAFGTAGYVLIEGWSAFDALYMTVTTVTTVGYREIYPLSKAGQAFTLILILAGVGTLFYVLGNLARFVLEGELQQVFGRYRSGGKVKTFSHHYIVCGYGQMGQHICKELRAKPYAVVIVEKNPDRVASAQRDGFVAVEGDATQDHVLVQAGVDRAKGLVSVVNTDVENLYIVLTARGLNKDLYIVARAGEEGSEQKLMRAGANRVSSPYLIGGMQVAQILLRPNVVDFLELATKSEHLDLQIEEITIEEGSRFDGKTPCECGLDQDRGLIMVGIKRKNGHLEFNPGPQVMLEEGDTLIVLGQPQSLKKIQTAIRSPLGAG